MADINELKTRRFPMVLEGREGTIHFIGGVALPLDVTVILAGIDFVACRLTTGGEIIGVPISSIAYFQQA